MKRQYDYTVRPGVTLPQEYTNQHIFERGGDDNKFYFTDHPVQITLNGSGGPAPWSAGDEESVQIVAGPNRAVVTFLCEESQNARRVIQLAPGSSVKIFVDAWEHYQTVPLIMQAMSVSGQSAHLDWRFFNYIPITGPISGSLAAASGSSLNLQPPVFQTLGHTNRSPTGEFPVSQETKNRACQCASERPFLLVQAYPDNVDDILMSLKIAK